MKEEGVMQPMNFIDATGTVSELPTSDRARSYSNSLDRAIEWCVTKSEIVGQLYF